MTELEKLEVRLEVTKDVPDNCLVGGVPAKKIKDIENDVE